LVRQSKIAVFFGRNRRTNIPWTGSQRVNKWGQLYYSIVKKTKYVHRYTLLPLMHGLVQVTLLIFLLGLDKHLNRIEVVQEVLQG